jgi:hypothetical protein
MCGKELAFLTKFALLRLITLFIHNFSRTEVVLQEPANAKTVVANAPILKMPILQLVGSRSAFINETIHVNTKLDPTNSNWVKINNACGLILDEKSEEVTEAILLFLQGLGYCKFSFSFIIYLYF